MAYIARIVKHVENNIAAILDVKGYLPKHFREKTTHGMEYVTAFGYGFGHIGVLRFHHLQNLDRFRGIYIRPAIRMSS